MAEGEILKTAATVLGAGGGLAAAGAFLNALINGTQAREKDLREGQAGEIKSLRDELRLVRIEHTAEMKQLRQEMSELRDELEEMRGLNSRLFSQRETARFLLGKLEREHGKPETVWPTDTPTGGTP